MSWYEWEWPAAFVEAYVMPILIVLGVTSIIAVLPSTRRKSKERIGLYFGLVGYAVIVGIKVLSRFGIYI